MQIIGCGATTLAVVTSPPQSLLLRLECISFLGISLAYRCVPTYLGHAMKISNHSAVPVYTISGSSTARPLPEWLARKRRRSLKNDPEYANRIELLQDFEFEEASQCIRVSDDGQWVMSTGKQTQSLPA